MALVGIDLGSHAIKAVEIEKKRGKDVITAFASGRPFGEGLSSEQLLDKDSLSKSVKDVFREGNFSTLRVNVALSEADVFTQIVSLPKMSPKEQAKSIQWEAQQYIPLDLKNVNFDYQPIDEFEGKIRLLLVAAPKDVVSRFVDLIQKVGLEPVALETSMQALSRLKQFAKDEDGSTLIVNIGAKTTDIGIVCRQKLRLTRSLSFGGAVLARAVAEKLDIPLIQAEEYQRSYGLDDESLEGKITSALDPLLATLLKELTRSVDFYDSRGYGDKVSRLCLCGGTAQLPGLLPYFVSKLNLEARIVDPLFGVDFADKVNRHELEDSAPSFALAVGLALNQS